MHGYDGCIDVLDNSRVKPDDVGKVGVGVAMREARVPSGDSEDGANIKVVTYEVHRLLGEVEGRPVSVLTALEAGHLLGSAVIADVLTEAYVCMRNVIAP